MLYQSPHRAHFQTVKCFAAFQDNLWCFYFILEIIYSFIISLFFLDVVLGLKRKWPQHWIRLLQSSVSCFIAAEAEASVFGCISWGGKRISCFSRGRQGCGGMVIYFGVVQWLRGNVVGFGGVVIGGVGECADWKMRWMGMGLRVVGCGQGGAIISGEGLRIVIYENLWV